MICPNCGSHIADSTVVCPACRFNVRQELPSTRSRRRYCATCAALLPAGATACPKCGTPCEDSAPQEGPAPLGTHAQELSERPEGALPAERIYQQAEAEGWKGVPASRILGVVAAAIAALLAVILILSLFGVFSGAGTQEAEPVIVAEPFTLDRLTGQDSDRT